MLCVGGRLSSRVYHSARGKGWRTAVRASSALAHSFQSAAQLQQHSALQHEQARRTLGFLRKRSSMAPATAAASNTAAAVESTVANADKAKDAPKIINRLEYQPPPYLIDQVKLNFLLNEDVSTVESRMDMKPNYEGTAAPPLELDGHPDVQLVSIKINGEELAASGYTRYAKSLVVHAPPTGSYTLEIVTHIKPQENTALEGLYKSDGSYCTQCEAQGFRHITYFMDRPDVMTKYTVRMEADKAMYPVLLSNGNLLEDGELQSGRHFAVWEDPWPKPCYLFALVAGNLEVKEDSFTTMSGRKVTLRIYTEAKDINKVDFALDSLKKSMKWDEDTYGLEYDLDLFNIVAVSSFNMGAMENKSYVVQSATVTHP